MNHVNEHLTAHPLKEGMNAFSDSILSYRDDTKKLNEEMHEIRELIDNDDLVVKVKSDSLERIDESHNDFREQINKLKNS